MRRVDPSQFSNVASAVQRTATLTGGSVRGLPGGVVIDGLTGAASFGSDITEAQKEYDRGRMLNALERIKQIESQFSGMAGRWNGTVQSLISSTRQGNQQLPLQKLNEVKSAQTKMQQLIRPAEKAFRDLVSALEQAIANAPTSKLRDASPNDSDQEDASGDEPSAKVNAERDAKHPEPSRNEPVQAETPDPSLLGNYANKYDFGPKLEWKKSADQKKRIVPQLQNGKFYFFAGLQPPRVVRIREVKRSAMVIYDADQGQETLIEANHIRILMGRGIWALQWKGNADT